MSSLYLATTILSVCLLEDIILFYKEKYKLKIKKMSLVVTKVFIVKLRVDYYQDVEEYTKYFIDYEAANKYADYLLRLQNNIHNMTYIENGFALVDGDETFLLDTEISSLSVYPESIEEIAS
jgi:hypothetical protein